MDVILGIDTGGTYTDGVVIEYESKKVLHTTKVFTTKNDLHICINNCLKQLCLKCNEHVCMVCLSTTLATNAVVEGKRVNVGLITIGMDEVREYPALIVKNIRGKLDIMGREVMPVSEREIIDVLKEMAGKVEAIAISGYASVKNPSQELFVKQKINEVLSIPVVCAHELTSTLGFYERGVTAVLNAGLVPVITELMESTRKELSEFGISAPIVIVKGDGHVMINGYAEDYPVETVLSGPAASLLGGKLLSKLDNAVIVDIGGTTLDIVGVYDGEGLLDEEGILINHWKTRVKAVRVHTYGLGGDSYLRINNDGEISFGPRRVVPLCVATVDAPWIKDELKDIALSDDYVLVNRQETDCFRLFKEYAEDDRTLTDKQKKVLSLLKNGAHSALYLAKMLDTDIDSLEVEELVEKELIQTISMTPTDLLHAENTFDRWDNEAASIGANLLSWRIKMKRNEFIESSKNKFINCICRGLIESLCSLEGMPTDKWSRNTLNFFIDRFISKEFSRFDCSFKINVPIVGVGASAGVWLKEAVERLGADFILPDHNEIANAIGAAVGDVRESLEATICFDNCLNHYTVYLPTEKVSFKTLDEAKEMAAQKLRQCAYDIAGRSGIEGNCKIDITEDIFYYENICTGESNYIKTTLKATIIGDLAIEKQCDNVTTDK